MKLKQYIKHGAIVVALSATTVFAATSWPTTAGIENGQIIQAPTIRDGLQYLYERSWNFVDWTGDGLGLFTNQQVSIGGAELLSDTSLHVTGKTASDEYCDGEGENCIDTSRMLEVGGARRPDDNWTNVTANVSFDNAYDRAPIVHAIVKDAEFGGPCRGYNVDLEAPVANVTASGFSVTYLGSRSGCGWRKVKEIAWFVLPQPVENNMTVSFDTYAWAVGPWVGCEPETVYVPADKGTPAYTTTVPARSGNKTRTLTCRSNTGATVANSLCPSTRPSTTEACYTETREPDRGVGGDE